MTTKHRTYAVLIPSKGRPGMLEKQFAKCSRLDSPSTFVALEKREENLYAGWRRRHPKVSVVWVENPEGIMGVPRDALRAAAVQVGFPRYVMSDDDCWYPEASLAALVEAHEACGDVVAGFSQLLGFYNADAMNYLSKKVGPHGVTVFPAVSYMFWVVSHEFYAGYCYPPIYNDDIHMGMTLISRGVTTFWICKEAKYTHKLWQPGGAGNVAERTRKIGLSVAKLAEDFPEWMTDSFIALRVPYTAMMERERNRRKKERG